MNIRTVRINQINIAIIQSSEAVVGGAQDMLDLMAEIRYEHGCGSIAMNKEAITEDFFKLSTGIAGEIAQKVANYRIKLAIIGDFSGYASKPLQDYMYECNRSGPLYFVKDEDGALEKLGAGSSW